MQKIPSAMLANHSIDVSLSAKYRIVTYTIISFTNIS